MYIVNNSNQKERRYCSSLQHGAGGYNVSLILYYKLKLTNYEISTVYH